MRQIGTHQCRTGRVAWSPFVVRFCWCAVRERGRTPPLQRVGQFYVFMIRCGKPAIAHRADRDVRPYRGAVRFRRWCVYFCNCTLPGRARHRPLRTYYVVAAHWTILWVRPAGRGRAPPLWYDETLHSSKTRTLPLISRLRRQLSLPPLPLRGISP